jgi:holo-[acyl-carrier-protein] synthase
MIVGVGTDVCALVRIAAAYERHGERFVQRVLGERERVVWAARGQRSPERALRYLATRFSAKEAFSKAIGLGMRMPMAWRRCEILNAPSGQPQVHLNGDLADWFAQRGWLAHVSVSDELDTVTSFVVVERP